MEQKTPLKLVHIVLGRANPNRMNGVNRVVHNLATKQTHAGLNTSVWGLTSSYLEADDLERTYKTRWFPNAKQFFLPHQIKTAIRDTDERTVFHLHGGFIPAFYSLSKTLKKYNKKFFLTPHGTYTEGAIKKNYIQKRFYFKFLEKGLLNRSRSIQCLGHSEASDLKKLLPNARTTLIPNGQNFDELKTSSSSENDKKFIIGYCGRITAWQKGLDILLDSFLHYRKVLGGTGELHLIGDGEYLEEMKTLATKHSLNQHMLFYGSLFGEQKIEVLKRMKLFVHTSRNEGLPTAVIEAAALEIPCLVSEKTSMDTYINKAQAGFTYTGTDYKKIAALLIKAQQEHEKETLVKKGANAKQMVLENFDWSIIAKQTIEWYES